MDSKKRKQHSDIELINIYCKNDFTDTDSDPFIFRIDKIIWDSDLVCYIRKSVLSTEKENIHKWIASIIQEDIYDGKDIKIIINSLFILLNYLLPNGSNDENNIIILKKYIELIKTIRDNELLNSVKINSKFELFTDNMKLLESGENGDINKLQQRIQDYYDTRAMKNEQQQLPVKKRLMQYEENKQDWNKLALVALSKQEGPYKKIKICYEQANLDPKVEPKDENDADPPSKVEDDEDDDDEDEDEDEDDEDEDEDEDDTHIIDWIYQLDESFYNNNIPSFQVIYTIPRETIFSEKENNQSVNSYEKFIKIH